MSLLHDLLDSRLDLRAESLDELRSNIVCLKMMELAAGHESWTMSRQFAVAQHALSSVVHMFWHRW